MYTASRFAITRDQELGFALTDSDSSMVRGILCQNTNCVQPTKHPPLSLMSTPNAALIVMPEPEDLANQSLEPVHLDDSILFTDAKSLLFSEFRSDDSDDVSLSPACVDDSDFLATSSTETKASEERSDLRAKEAIRRRVYRRVQKLEREQLRRLERDLSKELDQLQRIKADEKTRFEASRSPAYLFWKSLAARHQDERLLAEAQQQELTAAVGAQTVYINTLERILLKFQSQGVAARIPK